MRTIKAFYQFIKQLEICRIGHCGYVDPDPSRAKRDEQVPKHQIDRDFRKLLVVDRRFLVRRQQVNVRANR
jgi:hypothetical protein